MSGGGNERKQCEDCWITLNIVTAWSGKPTHFALDPGKTIIFKMILATLFSRQQYWQYLIESFPSGSAGKESTCNAGDLGSIPRLGRSPGGGRRNPLRYFCLESPQEQQNLAGYSPWDDSESDTTEWLSPARERASVEMSINREVKSLTHLHTGITQPSKSEKISLSAAWMDRDLSYWVKSVRKGKKYITYGWNL